MADLNRPDVIAMCGLAGAGKDTVAEYLAVHHGYRRIAFADGVRAAALALDPLVPNLDPTALDDTSVTIRLSDVVSAVGWYEAKKQPEVRRTLQRVGTDAGTKIHHSDLWVDLVAPRMEDARRDGVPLAFTDLRFPHENLWLKKHGAVVWRVERDQEDLHQLPGDLGVHASEQHAASLPADLVINNRGSIGELHLTIETALAAAR